MTWKFTDAKGSVVFRFNLNGSMESRSVTESDVAAWIAAGNVPDAAEPLPVPTITKRQALLYLLPGGKAESDVLAAINSIPDAHARTAALIAWNYPDGDKLDRANPLFDQLGPALGIADMDAAFRAAALL